MSPTGPLNIYCVLPESGVALQSERFWQFLKEERQEKKLSGAHEVQIHKKGGGTHSTAFGPHLNCTLDSV